MWFIKETTLCSAFCAAFASAALARTTTFEHPMDHVHSSYALEEIRAKKSTIHTITTLCLPAVSELPCDVAIRTVLERGFGAFDLVLPRNLHDRLA